MSLYNKIRIMKPDQAAEWVQDNPDKLAKLDPKTKDMLQRKLSQANVEVDAPEPGRPAPEPEPVQPGDFVGPAPEPQEVPTKRQRFICNKIPNRWILVGAKEVRFTRGEFVTDDPDLINAIVNEPDFGLWILADSPEMRKLYKRRR